MREWELSYRLGMRPWIAVAYSAPVAAATAVFIIYPIGQGSFSDGMPLGKVIFCLTFVYSGIFIKERTTLINFNFKVLMSLKGILKTCLDGEHPINQVFTIKKEKTSAFSETREYIVAGNPVRKLILQTTIPGVYMIYCTKNKMRYYGETSSLLVRLSAQKDSLKLKKNICVHLQRDWNTFGQESFDFVILEAGPEWEDRDKRRNLETELILADKGLVYNTLTGQSRLKRLQKLTVKPSSDMIREGIRTQAGTLSVPEPASGKLGTLISINGVIYSSITKAARVLNSSFETIKKRMNDPNELNYFEIDPNKIPGIDET